MSELRIPFTVPEGDCDIVACYCVQQQQIVFSNVISVISSILNLVVLPSPVLTTRVLTSDEDVCAFRPNKPISASNAMNIFFTVPEGDCDIVACYSVQQQQIESGFTMSLENHPNVRLYGIGIFPTDVIAPVLLSRYS